MMRIRHAEDRGKADFGWLKSHHTFSFGEYWNPEWMGYRVLRVLNDDVVAPGGGFGLHPHRDMEIVSIALEGAIAHADSMGNQEVLRAGEVQRMTAGRGIRHSEFNHSPTEPLRFLQIWILPERPGLDPGYEQRAFSREDRMGRWQVMVHPDGLDGSLRIHQDASIHAIVLRPGERADWTPATGRGAWVQVVTGSGKAGEHALARGDGLAFEREGLEFEGGEDGLELVLLDLP